MVRRIGPFPPLSPDIRAQSLEKAIAEHAGEVWVFGYGSLMWDSELPISKRIPAVLHDYRRSFCVWTAHARGTPDRPGLALGLQPCAGQLCHGMALKLDPSNSGTGLVALWDREMWTDVYHPVWRELETACGKLTAIAFEVNLQSKQFSDELTMQESAEIIAKAVGVFGTCRDYLFDTVLSLQRLGIYREEFKELCENVEQIKSDREGY